MSDGAHEVLVTRRTLDCEAESHLKSLLEDDALLEGPHSMALSGVEWGGCPVGPLELVVEADGTLSVHAEPPSAEAICDDPDKWSPEILKGRTKFGVLEVAKGASRIASYSFQVEAGSQIMAQVHGWKWSAATGAQTNYWAARVSFSSKRGPTLWSRPAGNVLVRAADGLHRVWRLRLGSGKQAFFGARSDRWFVLVQSDPGRVPESAEVGDLATAVSFVLGEPITIGLMHQLGAAGEIAGLARLDLARTPIPTSSHQPALPFRIEPEWLVRFVERALSVMAAEPGGIVHVAMHSYLWGLLGTIDMKFLQSWVGTEALAGWMLKTGAVATPPGVLLVRDPAAWREWVLSQQTEIRSLAASDDGDRLFQKVMSASAKAASKVEKVFVASRLSWTEEMEDVQDIRNAVAHAAVIAPAGERNWSRDRRRVGLMQTMLTALLAKVIGYDGPIADRSKTCLSPTGDDRPTWWKAEQLAAVTDFRGADTVPGNDDDGRG